MSAQFDGVVEGRVWLFPEPNINTDLIMPNTAYRIPPAERLKLIFASVRPGWNELVEPGDLLVGGKNFGTGSARPGANLLRMLGIAGLIADSINELFYRNCVNFALPALEAPGISAAVEEGDRLRLDARNGVVINLRSGVEFHGPRMPDLLWEIIQAGGLIEQLKAGGYI